MANCSSVYHAAKLTSQPQGHAESMKFIGSNTWKKKELAGL